MNKNLIMIVGALCVVLLIVFWLQYSIVKSLQKSSTGVDGTTGQPINSTVPINAPNAGGTATSTAPAAPAASVGKKTTISAPVHKKH